MSIIGLLGSVIHLLASPESSFRLPFSNKSRYLYGGDAYEWLKGNLCGIGGIINLNGIAM